MGEGLVNMFFFWHDCFYALWMYILVISCQNQTMRWICFDFPEIVIMAMHNVSIQKYTFHPAKKSAY